MPNPADQPTLAGREIILREGPDRRDQFRHPVAARRRDRETSVRLRSPPSPALPSRRPSPRPRFAARIPAAFSSPGSASRSTLVRTSQRGASPGRTANDGSANDRPSTSHSTRSASLPAPWRGARLPAPPDRWSRECRRCRSASPDSHRDRLHLDRIARGAGVRRDDRHLAPRQRIHQRRFADIRGTGDRHHQPVAPAARCARSPPTRR